MSTKNIINNNKLVVDTLFTNLFLVESESITITTQIATVIDYNPNT